MRRTFDLGHLSPDDLNRLRLYIYHDEGVDIFTNGVLAYHSGKTTDCDYVRMSNAARKAVKLGGENLIAAHCDQTKGGQYVDVGIVERDP
jgi:hypothetical protein